MSKPLTDDEVAGQVHRLYRQCFYQRTLGTDLDNKYPYHKHLPDCDICLSAELIKWLWSETESEECAFCGEAIKKPVDHDAGE